MATMPTTSSLPPLPDMFGELLLWISNLSDAYHDHDLLSKAKNNPELMQFLIKMFDTLAVTHAIIVKTERAHQHYQLLSDRLRSHKTRYQRLEHRGVNVEYSGTWNTISVLCGVIEMYSNYMGHHSDLMTKMCGAVDKLNDHFLQNYAIA